jgi:hypothetical protein
MIMCRSRHIQRRREGSDGQLLIPRLYSPSQISFAESCKPLATRGRQVQFLTLARRIDTQAWKCSSTCLSPVAFLCIRNVMLNRFVVEYIASNAISKGLLRGLLQVCSRLCVRSILCRRPVVPRVSSLPQTIIHLFCTLWISSGLICRRSSLTRRVSEHPRKREVLTRHLELPHRTL